MKPLRHFKGILGALEGNTIWELKGGEFHVHLCHMAYAVVELRSFT